MTSELRECLVAAAYCTAAAVVAAAVLGASCTLLVNDAKAVLACCRRWGLVVLLGAMSFYGIQSFSKGTNGMDNASSPTNGVNRTQAPLRIPRLPSPVELAADVVRISEIAVSTNGIDLVLHRPPTNDLAAVEVVLVGSTNLVTATWEPYTNVVFGVDETNVAVFVDQAQLDAHAVSNACFFAFINAGDHDEDGLANWHERFNLKTDPDDADSDKDGLSDEWEVTHGFDPRASADCVLSTRPDGIPDVYVIKNGGDPAILSDASLVPVFIASENSGTNLAAALAASVQYSIIEVEPGVHEGAGWTGIRFPPHPVFVRPASGGPNRTVLRHRDRVGNAGGGMAAFEIPSSTPPGTCVEGLRVELLGLAAPQIAFWVGSSIPGISGTGCGAVFRDVVVRMPRPDVQNWAWYLGSPTNDTVVLSGCAVDARGATAACGVWAVSSGPLLVENCSFLNFPFGGDTRFEYGVGIGLDATARQMPTNTAVRVTGTLFDASFTNGWALARVGEATNGGVYSVSFDHSLLPGHFPSVAVRWPDATEGLIFGETGTAATGQLTNEQSLAVGACPQPRFSRVDLNGLERAATTDIGAFVYTSVPTSATDDTDGDGVSDADEFAQGLDPFSNDTDCDGVSDADEIAQGTDPADIRSFLRTILVTVVNADMIENATNYVAWGMTPDWTADDIHDMLTATGEGGGDAFEGLDSAVALFVKAYRDLDRDGVCDSAREPVIVCEVGRWSVTPSFRLAFGDVDGDGVSDAAEFADGTNPNDALNFRFAATLAVANVDATASITNHLAWGAAAGDIAEEATFTGTRFERSVSLLVTNGHLFVSCWRDLDKDGIYTPGVDVRQTWRFGCNDSGAGRTVSLRLGDADGDGVPDGVERAEGTDWNASTNYCCNISVTYTGIFQTTNALTFAAQWGTNTVWGPTPVTTKTWTHDFGHRVATHGERAGVKVWDDANHNGVWDDGETGNSYDFKPSGHTTCVTNELAYGHFDRNSNNLPDWWEAETQLSADGGNVKEYEDPDEDGLINLHEFWAGTNPLVPDGSNTLLSVCARSVDERIRGIDVQVSLNRFENFYANAPSGVFSVNKNFWLRDIDTSCVSVWNDRDEPGSMSATAITQRHVILARHWKARNYAFCNTNGVVVWRRIVDSKNCAGSDLDVGQLDEPLPPSFKPVKILPCDYSDYILTGKYLPSVCITQRKAATILEIGGMDETTVSDSGVWHHCVEFLDTNVVSSVRAAVRGTTHMGNSGSPSFFLVDNELVFLCSRHLGYRDVENWAYGWGPAAYLRLTEIQNKINELEGTSVHPYQIESFDMSGRPLIRNLK